ncbi:MAG TPA: hypothetical protein VGG12_06945 [Methylovirgula sp.]
MSDRGTAKRKASDEDVLRTVATADEAFVLIAPLMEGGTAENPGPFFNAAMTGFLIALRALKAGAAIHQQSVSPSSFADAAFHAAMAVEIDPLLSKQRH